MIEENQIYIVVDTESDGPVAGLYSMLSIGAIATTQDSEIGSFYKKIERLEGASQHPRVMAWWETQPTAWQEATSDTQPPENVLPEFCEWIESLGKQPIFVANPTGFDYAMVSWYLWKYCNKDPFTDKNGAPRTLDVASFSSGKLKLSLAESSPNKLPQSLRQVTNQHSHNALEDAKELATILRNLLNC